MRDYRLENGRLSPEPVVKSAIRFTDPGATPAVSANGTKNGIVWLISQKTWDGPDRSAVLYAHDAEMLLMSSTRASRTSNATMPGALCALPFPPLPRATSTSAPKSTSKSTTYSPRRKILASVCPQSAAHPFREGASCATDYSLGICYYKVLGAGCST